jgi:hypothetical protein
MKTWEHETIRDGMSQRGTLADWPELREALANNGISLPGLVSMAAVREICRLILAERKTTEATANREEAKELQRQLLDRDIYASRHDVAQCYAEYCEEFTATGWQSLDGWELDDHIEPVDYIAARIGNDQPN